MRLQGADVVNSGENPVVALVSACYSMIQQTHACTALMVHSIVQLAMQKAIKSIVIHSVVISSVAAHHGSDSITCSFTLKQRSITS